MNIGEFHLLQSLLEGSKEDWNSLLGVVLSELKPC